MVRSVKIDEALDDDIKSIAIIEDRKIHAQTIRLLREAVKVYRDGEGLTSDALRKQAEAILKERGAKW